MQDQNIYRIVGGEAKALLDKKLDAMKDFRKRAHSLVQEHGGKIGFGSHGSIVAVKFDSDPPRGWRRPSAKSRIPRDEGYAVPDRRLKEGKAIDDEITRINVSGKDALDAADFFNGETWVFTMFHMHIPKFGVIEGTDIYVVIIHKDSEAKPIDGLESMPLSEYYAIKEANKTKETV